MRNTCNVIGKPGNTVAACSSPMVIFEFGEPIGNVDRRERKLARKNSNGGEQSHRDALRKPYHLSPGVGYRQTELWRPALLDGCARSRRDVEDWRTAKQRNFVARKATRSRIFWIYYVSWYSLGAEAPNKPPHVGRHGSRRACACAPTRRQLSWCTKQKFTL
jgi:hypothetical protein